MAEPTDDKIKKIYTALSQGGNNLGTEEQFRTALGDEGKRKKIFDALSTENNLGTYEQFSAAVSSVPSPKQLPQQTMKVPTQPMMESLQTGMSGVEKSIPSQMQTIPAASTSQLVGSTSESGTSPLDISSPKINPGAIVQSGTEAVTDQVSKPNIVDATIDMVSGLKKQAFDKRMGLGDYEIQGGEKVINDVKRRIQQGKSEDRKALMETETSFSVNPQTGESVYMSVPTQGARDVMVKRRGDVFGNIGEEEMIVEANPSNHEIGSAFLATDKNVTLPSSRGMGFWNEAKMMNDQVGEKNIEQMQILGTSDHSKIQLPSEMRKVLADYESSLKANDPKKFTEYSDLTRVGGKTLPYEEVYNYDQEKNTWTVDPKYFGIQDFIKTADKEKGVTFHRPTEVKQIEYLMGAIDNQAKMITADYMAQTGGGKKNVQYEDGTTAVDRYKNAMQELSSVNDYIENNSTFSEKIKNTRESQANQEAKQKKADELYAERYSHDPIGATIGYSLSEAGRSFMSIPRTVFSIPEMVGIEIPEMQATAQRFKKDEEKFLPKATELQKSILERPLNILTTGSEMIADIYTMGKMGIGGGGSRAAMATSSFVNTYNDYNDAVYDRLVKEGVPVEKAREAAGANAFLGSGLTALVESFAPGMEKLIAGGVKKEASESLIKSLAKGEGVKESVEKAAKTYFKEMPKEQAEELTNLITDKIVNAKTNYDLGHQYMDADINAGEVAETLIMTGVVGGFAAMRDYKSPNTMQRSALYEALNDPKNFQEKVDSALEKGLITEAESEKMNKDIEELKTVIKGLPDGLDIDDQKGMDLVLNLYKKKQIKEADKGAYVDDKFAPIKEKTTNDKLAEIDSEIDNIVKVPEVKEEDKKVRETSFVNEGTGESGFKPAVTENTTEEVVSPASKTENVPAVKDSPLNVIEEKLNIGDIVYGNISGQKVSGRVEDIGRNKGQIVVDIIDQNGNRRFLYSKNIETIEPKKKEIEKLTPEQNKRHLELINKEEITADEIKELGELNKIKRGDISNPIKIESEIKTPQITITNNEGAKEFKLDDKFYSEKEFTEALEKPEVAKAINDGTMVVSVNNPSPEIQTKLETLKTKPDVKEQTQTENGEETLLTETPSILNADADLKGMSLESRPGLKTQERYVSESVKERTPTTKGYSKENAVEDHQNYVQEAIDDNLYEKMINEGHVSAQDVKTIIESAGLKVPESIIELIKTEPISSPEKTAAEEPKPEKTDGEEKQRKFAGQVINDEEIRPEVKTAMKKKTYDVIPNDVTIAEADQLIKDTSPEEISKAVLDTNNNMPFRVRAVIGMQLIKQFNEKGHKEADVDKKNEYYDQAADIADSLAKKGTEMGQGIQAFSLWSATSVEGILRTTQRAVIKTKADVDKKNKETRGQIKKNYNKAVKKSADEAVKNATDKYSSKIKTFGMTKEEIKSKKDAALEKFKKATKGSPLTSGGLNKEAIEAVSEYGYYLFVDGVRKFKEWSSSMSKSTGLNSETLKDIWNGQVMNNGKTLAELATANDLSDVVFKHYTEPGNTTLAEKVQKEFGLEEEEAKTVSKEIETEYEKVSKKNIDNELGKGVPAPLLSKPKTRKAIKKLKASTEPLTDEIIKEAFYESNGIKEAKDVSPETMDKINELDKQRQAAPEGSFLKNNITVEMLSTLSKESGIPWSDVVWGIWYANVLSGQETQILNATSNAQNLVLEFGVSAIEQGLIKRDPKAVWGGFKAIISGLTKGLTEAQAVMKEGVSNVQADALNLEAKPALENVKIGTLHKYVPRFMAAIDTIGYTGAQNMMAYETAREIAKEEGLRGEELKERTDEILGLDEQAYNEAKLQAEQDVNTTYDAQGKKKEGSTYRRDIRRRRNEILFQNTPADVQEKSMNFGRFATYNYTPKGWIGAVAQMLSGLNRAIPPFRLIVPFIRVVANVLNQQLDYSPYGYLRAMGINASSWTEKEGAETSTRQNNTSKERNREYIKATIGTTLMVAPYALAAMHDDEEDPEFDVTGKGPSDFNKKNQLYAQGWKPYSVKIGGKYISYQYSPFAFVMSFVGNWRDNEKFHELDSKSFGVKSVYALKSSASGIMDMSFLSGLSGFLDALTSSSDPEKAAENTMKSFAKTGTSFVIPNMFKQIDNIYRDNTVYNADDLMSYILADIPVVRSYSGLKPKLNNLGEPVQKEASTFRRFISNKNESQAWKLLADKRIFLPGTKLGVKNFKGEPMSPDEFYTFVQKSGKATKEFLIKNEKEIRAMENAEAQVYVSNMVAKIRKRTKKEMFKEENSEDSTDFEFNFE